VAKLAADRYVDVLPGRGAQVRRVTADELVETFQVREVLESYAFEILCEKQLPVPDMRDHLAHMEDEASLLAWRGNDTPLMSNFARLDYDFHLSFVAATGNTVLLDTFGTMRSRMQRIAVSSITAAPTRLSTIAREHLSIATALLDHDLETARATLHDHLRPERTLLSHHE
jgi:DNA-binding GntR family transcriptional regulator